MPIIKIAGLLKGENWTDAVFEFQDDSTIDLIDGELLVCRFDPDDFLAVADAYLAFKKRIEDEKKRGEN